MIISWIPQKYLRPLTDRGRVTVSSWKLSFKVFLIPWLHLVGFLGTKVPPLSPDSFCDLTRITDENQGDTITKDTLHQEAEPQSCCHQLWGDIGSFFLFHPKGIMILDWATKCTMFHLQTWLWKRTLSFLLITDETFYSFITYSDCYNAVE